MLNMPSATETLEQNPDIAVRPQRCPSCRGVMLLLTDEYTCLERCVSCQRSSLIAWSSCQPVLRPSARV